MSAPHLPTRFAATNPPTDTLGRPLRDLRISVTDRCNFRCPYCMPAELYDQNYRFVARQALLDFDEITRLAKLFVRNGVRKIRLTGGEPLLRRGLPQLIAQLRGIDRELNADRRTAANEPNEAAERQLDLALTTNGSLLATQAETLAEAGLNRITLSLDSLDPATFRRLNGGRASIEPVLEGLQAALKAGLTPIKINCVVQRGVNEDALLPLAALAQKHELSVRFIEYMDVGTCNGWKAEQVFTAREMLVLLRRRYPLEPIRPAYRGEVARRYRFADGTPGEIGFITSISQPFCGDCHRARLSCEGRWFTCLFAQEGLDLRASLRNGENDTTLLTRIEKHWQQRQDRYSELRSGTLPATSDSQRRIEMYAIGG